MNDRPNMLVGMLLVVAIFIAGASVALIAVAIAGSLTRCI